jgi:hypothetical protein
MMWYYRDDLNIGGAGEKLSFWLNVPGYGPSMLDSGRAYMGFGADSTGAYEFIIAPNTNQIMIYDDYPYGSFASLAATPYTFTRDGWYRCEVEFISSTEVICRLFDEDGTTLLADVSATRSGGFNLPGGLSFRAFDYGFTPRHFYIDTYDNGAPLVDPVIPTFSYEYMDNGIYYVDVMALDDDMYWDFSGPQPVFVGPATEDPADWISHNIIPIEVYNTDPVITPRISAFAELELSIRTTGQPNEDVEMRLYKGDTLLDSVICFHDGNEKIKVLSGHAFDMTEINDYRVEVEYFGTGGGANPTWIFSGHFPSGKVKELKHEFKDGDPVWHIGPDVLKQMIIGEDIIFQATAYDFGSDDLAFVWNFGDTTPFGVHIYANDNPSLYVGESDEATVIFNQDPDREPWFDKPTNTERSPHGNAMLITDTIIHIFDENQPHYYYVALTVMDDDVKDDYPSIQAPHSTGCDIANVEIDLTF